VLNTRPREQAGELSRLLRAAGYEPVEVPAIQVVAASDAAEIDGVLRRLRRAEYAWIVLSSANAARFFASAAGGLPATVPILCGAATAEALRLQPSVALERFSASAALQALESRLAGTARVLVPRAAEGRDELIDGLQQRGLRVDAPLCYRTLPAPIPVWQSVDVVTLCSPSAVAPLVAAWTPARLNSARVVCIGGTTGEAAREQGVRVDGTASSTSMAALVAAVDAVLRAPADAVDARTGAPADAVDGLSGAPADAVDALSSAPVHAVDSGRGARV
jgi:uroporphyrinogen-III synthase